MNPHIRPVRREDLASLIDLCAEHAAYERANFERDHAHAGLTKALFGEPMRLQCWIAADYQPIGYLTATTDFSTWQACEFLHMDCLYVREGHRNSGIGLRLFEALHAHAQVTGIAEIQWQTPYWNEEASRFYRRLGATETEKRRYRYRVLETPNG